MNLLASKLIKPLKLFLFGAFCVLGFAPFYFYPASILSLVGLFYYWHQASTPKQAAIDGFIYGLGLFGTGIYWIYISLHDFGNMPALMAGFSTFVLCAFMALFMAVVGALSVYLSANQSNRRLVAIPVFWALSDWVRSWIFTGFPWLTMGYSQVPSSPLAGYMPIIGVYGVSLITVLIASLLSLWLIKLKAKDARACIWRRYAIALFLLLWIGGSVLKLVEWTTPIGKPIKAALVQGNIAQETKWSPETAQQTIDLYVSMVKDSVAKLIILPETALPVLSSQLDPSIKAALTEHVSKDGGNIIIGIVEFNDATGEYYNSAISYGDSLSQTYQKSHLVPFGEFIPLKQVFGWIYRDWLNMPLSDLSRGSKLQKPMQLGSMKRDNSSINSQKVAVNICYEDVFGEEIIRQLPAATLLVNISNDAWYGQSNAAYQHMQFSQARALETGRMVLRATNTGATAMIDTHGNVVAQAPNFTQTTLNVTTQGYTGSTPYVRWGNELFLAICFIAFLFIGLPKFLAGTKYLLSSNFLVSKGKTK